MTTLKSMIRVAFARPAATALAAGLLVAGTASAQYIAPDVHGYAAQQIRQRYSSGQGTARVQAPAARYAPAGSPVYYSPSAYPASVVPSPSVGSVPAVPAPAAPATAYVGLTGPDGVVRYYTVEGGADAFRRVIVVRPGQPQTAEVVAPQAR